MTAEQVKEVIQREIQDDCRIYLYVDLEYYTQLLPALLNIQGNMSIGVIDTHKFTIIPSLDSPTHSETNETILGR